MSTSVSLNGTTYTIPATGENTWGDNVSSYLIALGSGVLQKAGGSFTLTAEVDFGATYGLKSAYYKSRGTNVSTAGEVRLANTEGIYWRNAANGANLALVVSASNVLTFNSLPISAIALGTANQVLGMNSGATAQEYKTISGTSSQITVTHGSNTITLSTPQDIATGSSPTFAGLTLSGVTASKALVTNGSSVVTASAVTATELGYLSGVTTPTGSGALVLATSPTLVTPVIGAASGTSLQLSGLTASKAMVTDASKNLTSSAVTATELGYLSGVTTPTGSGALVLANTPTLITPVLGVATATSINKLTITAPATSATLTIANGKTLTASNTLTFTGTDSSSVAFGAGGTVVYTSNDLSVFAATTSLQLKTLISDETGSGSLVFGTSPSLASPTFSDYTLFTESSAPSTPASGKVAVYAKTDKKMYRKDSNGTETEIGAGSGGGINYISANSDFEGNAVTGWATYADAAATTPADGTGGSPNSTFAATSSSPLRGTYSAIFTKSAANRQGEGFSYDFSIASADKSRPLLVTWEGSASANYTGSSGSEYLAVYVYDVTNATLITPASTTVAPGVSKGSTFFVATTSTSYRLIFHVAGTGTSSWTYTIDTVSVGPQSIGVGAAVTDWQTFTPTTQGFGTTSSEQFMYCRVGNTMNIIGVLTTGTVTGSEARVTLPNSLSVASIITTTSSVGRWERGSASASAVKTGTIIVGSGGTYLNFALDDYTNAVSPGSPQNGNALLSNTQVLYLYASVPISQWSSSNFQTADRAVEEFSYNTSTATAADDTTSFAYGSTGAVIQNITATLKRRVRFQQAIQATDIIVVEISEDRAKWNELVGWFNGSACQTMNLTRQSTTYYGVGISAFVNSTDVDIRFGDYANANGATYAASGSSWTANGGSSTYWRCRKISGGATVGYPVSSQNIIGRTDGVAPSAGYVGQVITTTVSSVTASVTAGPTAGVTSCASLSLTAGVWNVTGGFAWYLATAPGTGLINCGIEIYNSSDATVLNQNQNISNDIGSGGSGQGQATLSTIVNISAAKTVQLRIRADNVSGSPSSGGFTTRANSNTYAFYAVRIA